MLQTLQKCTFLIFDVSNQLVLSEIRIFWLFNKDTHFRINGELKGTYPSCISFLQYGHFKAKHLFI